MRPQSAAVILMLPFLDRDASSVEHAHAPAAACHGLRKADVQVDKLIQTGWWLSFGDQVMGKGADIYMVLFRPT